MRRRFLIGRAVGNLRRVDVTGWWLCTETSFRRLSWPTDGRSRGVGEEGPLHTRPQRRVADHRVPPVGAQDPWEFPIPAPLDSPRSRVTLPPFRLQCCHAPGAQAGHHPLHGHGELLAHAPPCESNPLRGPCPSHLSPCSRLLARSWQRHLVREHGGKAKRRLDRERSSRLRETLPVQIVVRASTSPSRAASCWNITFSSSRAAPTPRGGSRSAGNGRG